MNTEGFVELLRSLCLAHGISGHEQAVVRKLRDQLTEYPDLNIDNFGNISVKIKGSGKAPSLLFMAHTDEVGCVVNRILPNGLLSFKTVGCVAESTLPTTRVRVGELIGTVTSPPAHMAANVAGATWDTYIDIGAESREDAEAMGVRIGDPVSFDTDFIRIGKNRLLSRCIDDRVGCAILVTLLNELKASGQTPPGDVIFAFSVREETTMTGAKMLVNRLRPDCAIAIDTVPVDDTHVPDPQLRIGGGPVLQLMEGVMRSYVGNCAHPALVDALCSSARSANVPVQLCAEVGIWTTDGHAIHESGDGTPSAYVSIPRRYAHSASEVMDLRDAENALCLLSDLIFSMDKVSLSFV